MEKKLDNGKLILTSSKQIHGDDLFSLKKDHSLRSPDEVSGSDMDTSRKRDRKDRKKSGSKKKKKPEDKEEEKPDFRSYHEADYPRNKRRGRDKACCSLI